MLDQVLADLRGDPRFMRAVYHWQVLPARNARLVPFPRTVDARLRNACRRRGITELYTHQARCYELARAGRNVVLVTPTASGKTLAYNLPILQRCLEDGAATALYLFPTKALAQDQRHELGRMTDGAELPLPAFTFDGDTPGAIRPTVRAEGRLVITNPDMLHTGVLPNHPQWNRFLRALRFVVIDELHTYRGIFGSHLTNVVRRLRRVAAFYGAAPRFICCSATIGNPRQLAQRILEQEVELIDDNGAPAGERNFVLYNPPLVDRTQGIRRSVVLEAQAVATRLLLQDVKTIVFARSRVRTELIASYIRDALRRGYRPPPTARSLSVTPTSSPGDRIGPTAERSVQVASYRGGYLPQERRAIERGLRTGELAGVVATTALELGIDIGGLDASVLAGFPGTIAGSWQQAGRAGRRTATSLSILIASASPIDQFIIRHPQYFFERSPESGWVDPDNIYVLLDQLKCAVFELPFADAELAAPDLRPPGAASDLARGHGVSEPEPSRRDTQDNARRPGGSTLSEPFSGQVSELLRHLEQGGVVRHAAARWYWSDRSYPAENVSLRTSSAANVVIVDQSAGGGQVIGEMDLPSAKTQLYDGAIYLHRGAQFLVTRLDVEQRRCYVEQADGNYFTDAVVKSDLKILHRDLEQEAAELRLLLGDILLRRQATKFKKLRYRTHENIGYGDIHLPAEEMHTRALVLHFPPETVAGAWLAQCDEAQRSFIVDRLGVLVRNVAPVFLLCDPRDLGVAARLKDPELDCPALYVYDAYPGGSGLAEGLHHQLAQVLAGCRDLVAACECAAGCPSCIGPPAAHAPGGGVSDEGFAVAGSKRELLAALQHLVPALPGERRRSGARRGRDARLAARPYGATPQGEGIREGAPAAVAPGRP